LFVLIIESLGFFGIVLLIIDWMSDCTLLIAGFVPIQIQWFCWMNEFLSKIPCWFSWSLTSAHCLEQLLWLVQLVVKCKDMYV
jgi:hypothetical protein